MNCPLCSWPESRVIDTRYGSRRRRECGACRHRWTTVEVEARRVDAIERIEQAVMSAAGDLAGPGA